MEGGLFHLRNSAMITLCKLVNQYMYILQWSSSFLNSENDTKGLINN